MKKQVFALMLTAAVIMFSIIPATGQQMQAPAQQESSGEVSDAELEKFVDAMNGVNNVQKNFQQKMTSKVTESGLDVERFNEIANAQQNPNQEVDASETEMVKFQEAAETINVEQQKMQMKMQETIADAGMQVSRYQEIMNQVNQNPVLLERVQSLME